MVPIAQAGMDGIDRRTLIKRAAAGGALVWTAPVILDSLASPAAAFTCLGGCVLVQIPPDPGMDPVCDSTSQTVSAACAPTSPNCTSTTNLGAGFTLGSVCISGIDCGALGVPVFNLDTAGTTCFTATGASCSAPRQFLAAQAGLVDAAGNPSCIAGTVGAGGAQVVFGQPPGTTYTFFQLLIGCSCS
jgi:hypothetical protein